MKGIQLESNVIIGLNWDESQGIVGTLYVVPLNIYGAADVDDAVITDKKSRSYPFPSGKIGKSALMYLEYPRGQIPGADKAVIKIQFDGIPSTISKFLLVFTAANAEGKLQAVKKLKRVPAWCADPKGPMDVIGAGGKDWEADLAVHFADNVNASIPLEITRQDDGWMLSTIDDGVKQYKEVLKALEIQSEKPPPPSPPPKPQSPNPRSPQQPLANPKPSSSSSTTKQVVKLITGQKTDIPEGEEAITVTLHADANFKPDMSAFILNGDTRPKAIAEQLIFYNQPKGAGGAVTYDKESNSLTLSLAHIPADIIRIAVVLSIDEGGRHFGQAKSLSATFETKSQSFRYDVTLKAGTRFKAVDMCDVYRRKDKWRFNAKGKGIEDGLKALCEQYYVEAN